MKGTIQKIGQTIDAKIRTACDSISMVQRIILLLFLCFLFFAVTVYMFIDVFYLDRQNKMMEIEHIKAINIPQDTLKII